MSTGTSKVDKLLQMPSDSISEGVANFSKFPGGACPQTPLVLFAHYECKYLTSPTLILMTGLVVFPPFQKSRSAPESVISMPKLPEQSQPSKNVGRFLRLCTVNLFSLFDV